MTECRRCGSTFNLSRQWYVDNLCPSCKHDSDPEATLPGCYRCGEKIPPDERDSTVVTNRGPRGVERETLPVHARCK